MYNKVFFPLTDAQKSIWRIVKFYPETSFVNIAGTIRLRGPVQYYLLNKAVNIAIKANDAMRTRIVEDGKEPRQYFAEYREQQFEILDFAYPHGEKDFQRWEEIRSRARMKLLDSDLYEFIIIKINDYEGALFLKLHHIAADAWSMVLLTSEILQNYVALREDKEELPLNRNSYQEYIQFETASSNLSKRFGKNKEFWDQVFSTVPEFTGFYKKLKENSTNAERKALVLPQKLSLHINEFSRVYKVSPFCILLAVLTIYIWRITDKTDIVIGTPVLNRGGVKEKKTMGMFINTVPFRVKLKPDFKFILFAETIGKQWRTILKHQRYPFNLILKDFRDSCNSKNKLIDISLSVQNALISVEGIDYNTKWHFNGSELNSLTIHVNDRESTGTYIIDYDYLTDVFSEAEICRIHDYLTTLLNRALSNPYLKISEIEMLSPAQEHRLLWEFNSTQSAYPQEETIVSLFEQQVLLNPGKTALVFEDNSVTYQELNSRANQLAKFLRSRGTKQDSVVALLVHRSIELIVAILAVLKAGGAYLPIDPNYPTERINYMLKNSNCRLLLRHTEKKYNHLTFEGDTVELKDQNLYKEDTTNLLDKPLPEDLAYVIYTSGSTGIPKGVMVEHKSLNNLVHYFSDIIKPENKVVLSIATVSFDIFFKETIFPLLRGMRVILANHQESTLPYLLCNLVDRYKVNFMQATPTRMKTILNSGQARSLASLTEIIIGGESFPEPLLDELQQACNAQVFNAYGPTETAICVTIKRLEKGQPITIGKPMANTQIYILDQSLKPVPIGSTGEIYISGDGLARGYINNEELTKERFLPNPFISGKRMYKTGDLAKWLNNGEIEYIGRNDNQVKIRGLRIELGEIEDRLAKHSLIKEAVVICREDTAKRKYLCAYMTAAGEISIPELREYLAHYLPDYMVPAHFVVLDSFPLTPNGKVDRKALPEPDHAKEQKHTYISPRNALEHKLAGLWQEILKVPRVGIDDNLFALGGDSLAILETLSGLFPNDWGLSAQDFYDYPTLRRLSDKITGTLPTSSSEPDSQPVLEFKKVPLTQKCSAGDGEILLTGATGFLGMHILYELLDSTSRKIYCLIRGQEPEKRLNDLLRFYFPFLSTGKFKNRLIAISGDITQENCGLPENQYQRLTENVSTVIHAAALVKHYGNYEDFYRFNVKGTKELINFCVNHEKKLYYISTISVAGSYFSSDPSNKKFTENDLYIGQDYKSNVYVRSKFEAERLVANASEQAGLDAAVFRVGLLTGRYSDGQFQKNIEQNAFYRFLKSLIMLKAVPQDIVEEQFEFTPVDSCAKAIVNAILANRTDLARFHVHNHKTIKITDLIKAFQNAGITIRVLPREAFHTVVTSVSATDAGKKILSCMIPAAGTKGDFGIFSGPQIDSSLSVRFLQETGFEWPDIQQEYLLKVLNYMQNTGFIDVPSA